MDIDVRRPDYVLFGLSVILFTILLLEAAYVVLVSNPLGTIWVTASLSSLPFKFGLLYAAFWLPASRISEDRNTAIYSWIFGGVVVSLLLNLSLMIGLPPTDEFHLLSWIRWGITLGAGSGLVVGGFAARRIDKAIEAEQSRIRAEELELRNERLEQFANAISHDLQTPLQVAMRYLERGRKTDDEDALEQVSEQHDRMATLVEDMLRVARAGKTVQNPQAIPLAAVAEKAWSNVGETDADIEISVPDTVSVQSDRNRLLQIFENLFQNAIDHNEPPITICVGLLDRAETSSHERHTSGFFIEDDGSGIPESKQEAVFTHGYTTGDDGTGIGLSVVRDTVEAHDWSIHVTSSTEGGARFEVTNVELTST